MVKKVNVTFRVNDLAYEDKLDVLSNNVCKSILPLSITRNSDIVNVYYDISGYKCLAKYNEISAENILTVLENTVKAIEECSRYLFFPEEFVINLDTTYIDIRFMKVKFTYVPDKDDISLAKKLAYFTNELRKITTDNGKVFLEMLSHIFSTENVSMQKLKLLIVKLKREIKENHIY